MCIYKGSLNEIFDDEGAGITFAILFDDLADNFPKEKFQKLRDLIQSNASTVFIIIFFAVKIIPMELLLSLSLCCLI